MKRLSKILSDYQRTNHLTYEQTANHLHLSKSSLYAYINELRNPTIKSLSKIANTLNLDISYFLDTSILDETELDFLNQLRKEPVVYKWLLKYPKEKIAKIKKMISIKE